MSQVFKCQRDFPFFTENQCFKKKMIDFAHHWIKDISTIILHFYILVLILTFNIFCKDDIGQDLYRVKVVCYGRRVGGGWGAWWKPADLALYAVPVFENYNKSDLIQNKLKPVSLGTDWIENERYGQVFAKTSVFMPKTGSINSGTVQGLRAPYTLYTCIHYTVLIHTGGGGGGVEPERRGEGQQFTKLGRKYLHDWLYL